MSIVVKARVIRIGNSRGVRLPKTLLAQSGIEDEVELEVQGESIIIRPVQSPRAGWDAAFAVMAATGDDALLDAELPASDWDKEEWTWPSDASTST
jgi:antitoxin MazE